MAHQALDGADVDLSVYELGAEGLSETGWIVLDAVLDKGIVGFEDGIYGFEQQFISQRIAKEGSAGQLFSHCPIALEYFFQKGV